MSHSFDAELFAELGGVNCQARKGFFKSGSAVSVETQAALDMKGSKDANATAVHEVKTEVKNAVESTFEEPSLLSATNQRIENAVVVIGPSLDQVWENEASPAWWLWQNIMNAFAWDETQIVFYDLDHVASEEAAYALLEEIIDLGVEWVLTMDAEHAVSEQLADGLKVVEVPDLETMLADPYAKQSFFQSVVALQ